MARIHSICYSPQRTDHSQRPARYNRVPVAEATLIDDTGIAGDKKGKKGSKRQLNIIALEMAVALGAEGYKSAPGELGEQITLTGLDIDALPPGTRLKLGAVAEVELVEMRTGCDWFEEIHGLPRPDGRLGMMCRVIAGGPIAVGDAVTVIVQVT